MESPYSHLADGGIQAPLGCANPRLFHVSFVLIRFARRVSGSESGGRGVGHSSQLRTLCETDLRACTNSLSHRRPRQIKFMLFFE